jgi:hypothetical protein
MKFLTVFCLVMLVLTINSIRVRPRHHQSTTTTSNNTATTSSATTTTDASYGY